MANIRDVAADAGVARSTVSYVLSGNKKLPESTRQRVLASVAKLGYRPDPMARALALKRTNILGFLATVDTTSSVEDIDVFMQFVRAAMYAARSRGFDVLIMGKGEGELQGDVLADALVVMDVRKNDPRLPTLRSLGLPTVLVGIPGDTTGFSAIDLDFDAAGRACVAHFADLGHREIAVLGPPQGAYDREMNFQLRFRDGFLDECEQRGLRGICLPCEHSSRDGVDRWLEEAKLLSPGLTGIVAHAPSVVGPLFDSFAARGVTVPDDCSVITLAPQTVVDTMVHPINSIDLPGNEMVERAVNRVLNELEGSEPGSVELLPAVLHDRGSTAHPRGSVFEPLGSTTR